MPDTNSDFAIRDVVYSEHYQRRIARAVNQQILDFSKTFAIELLRAYPEGSSEFFVVVEALRRAGLGLVKQAQSAPAEGAAEGQDTAYAHHESAETGFSDPSNPQNIDAIEQNGLHLVQPAPVEARAALIEGPWAKK